MKSASSQKHHVERNAIPHVSSCQLSVTARNHTGTNVLARKSLKCEDWKSETTVIVLKAIFEVNRRQSIPDSRKFFPPLVLDEFRNRRNKTSFLSPINGVKAIKETQYTALSQWNHALALGPTLLYPSLDCWIWTGYHYHCAENRKTRSVKS